MRTPLNVALGRMQMLATGQVAPGQQQAVVDAAYRNLRSIWSLVNDLLEAARMASGRIELHRVPLDVATALGHSIADARRNADVHGVKLEMTCDAKDTTVFGDGERLRQVFDNLVHNAVKFTPSGGSVDIRVNSFENRVVVVVSDSGIGISAEELPLVFEPFHQGAPSRLREHGGLGLGLAIAKQLIEAHGGTIEAVSAGVGHGATFTVTLPTRSTIAA
jgi:hypothetical protein